MVSRFRRTLSFPTKPTPNPSRPSKSYHVRSISLPCRSHPLISQLHTEIQHLRTWLSQTQTKTRTSQGLLMLKALHDSVDDLLHLPQTQDSLRRRPDWAEALLRDSLLFADVFGILRDEMMALKEGQLGVQMGVRGRRNEAAAMGAYLKARKRVGKEVKRVVAEVRGLVRRPVPDGSLLVMDVGGNAELAMILRDVHDVTILSTIAILNGLIVEGSSGSSVFPWKLWRKRRIDGDEMRVCDLRGLREVEKMWGVVRKGGGVGIEERRCVLGKLEEVEKCIGEVESGSEGVFRSFLRARVSLLNILSQ